MLAEKNEFIKQSIVTLQELTADEKARMQMEARERHRRDLAASKELGKQESEEMIQSLKGTIEEQKNTIEQVQAEKERAEVEKEKALEKNKQFEAKTKAVEEENQRLRRILEEHGILEDDE